MDTFLIFIQLALMVFALYKKVLPYGFYNMLTCLTVLLMAMFGIIGLIISFKLNFLAFVSAANVLMALVCCYGIKKPSFPYDVIS